MAGRGRLRFRYIAFRIESERQLTEQNMIDVLTSAFSGRPPRLVVFRGNRGIVRCLNTTKDETIRALNAFESTGERRIVIKTIGTSGTIRKAREKFLS